VLDIEKEEVRSGGGAVEDRGLWRVVTYSGR
jgi:hypothetical protein